jgi:hypothetical protein
MSPALGGGGCRTFFTAMFRNKKEREKRNSGEILVVNG